MFTVRYYTQNTILKQQHIAGDYNPKPFSFRNMAMHIIVQRFSPFLIMAILFPVFIVYAFIARIEILSSIWLQLFVCIGVEFYLFFLDFVLWNYFEAINKRFIWIAELLALSVLTCFFL